MVDVADEAEEFARTSLDALRRFAYVICGSAAEADDLAQIAVVEVWRRWRVASANPEAYARRVIVTRNVSRWRRWRWEIPIDDTGALSDDPALGQVTDPEMWQALRRLPKAERTVVVLHVLYGFTFTEIAAMVDEPRGTVSSRYSRALKDLHRHLRIEATGNPDSVWRARFAL